MRSPSKLKHRHLHLPPPSKVCFACLLAVFAAVRIRVRVWGNGLGLAVVFLTGSYIIEMHGLEMHSQFSWLELMVHFTTNGCYIRMHTLQFSHHILVLYFRAHKSTVSLCLHFTRRNQLYLESSRISQCGWIADRKIWFHYPGDANSE